MLVRLARAQLANIGLKNASIWEEDFAFHVFSMAPNNKTADYRRDTLRRPILLKMPFSRMRD